MATLIPSLFSRYSMTQEEEAAGTKLNFYQLANLQNLMADAAEERVNLVFDPAKPVEFAQQEASIAGRIQVLRYLIDASNALEI